MLTRLTIELSEKERAALERQAKRNLRGLREQARYIIICALAANGAPSAEQPAPAAGSGSQPTRPESRQKDAPKVA